MKKKYQRSRPQNPKGTLRTHRVHNFCECGQPARRAGEALPMHPPLTATACERCAALEKLDLASWSKCGSDTLAIRERDPFLDVRNACDRWLLARGLKEIPFNGFKVAC